MSTDPDGIKTYKGTSMEFPHVASAIAAIWSSGIDATLEAITQGGQVPYGSEEVKLKLNYVCRRTTSDSVILCASGSCSAEY